MATKAWKEKYEKGFQFHICSIFNCAFFLSFMAISQWQMDEKEGEKERAFHLICY
jgi:hypothetical protein